MQTKVSRVPHEWYNVLGLKSLRDLMIDVIDPDLPFPAYQSELAPSDSARAGHLFSVAKRDTSEESHQAETSL
jgi:chemotaxis signal transduction protein